MVMDNHAAHKSLKVRAICNRHNVKIAFLPSVSSNLNPVERFWSVVKAEWSKYLVGHVVTEIEMPRILLNICARVGADAIKGINRSSHRLMVNVLDGHLV